MKRRGERAAASGDVTGPLATVVELGPGRLPDDAVAAAADLRVKVEERRVRGDGVTVAAVAGGTGVGKSSLVNALLGREVATVGVRRPTTSAPLAAVRADDAEARAVLDWLEIPDRVDVGDVLPPGLVVVDLPDHDSVAADHRRTAARLAGRVDVVVWVLDPVKYARADSHDGPLAELTAHAEVLLVVLNRIDELAPDAVGRVQADLLERLHAGGHDTVHVAPTSAVTGDGVEEVRRTLSELARERSAPARRLAGDAALLGERLQQGLDALPEVTLDAEALLGDVIAAGDGTRAVAEAGHLYTRAATAACRSPLARAVRRPVTAAVTALGGGRSSPEAAPADRAATTVRLTAALDDHLDVGRATGLVHRALDAAVTDAADAAAPAVADAVAGAGLAPDRRPWWTVVAGLRLATETVALVGALWLGALGVVAWLQLPDLPVPDAIGEVPWPTALLLGGLVLRFVIGVVGRAARRVGARRHTATVVARLRATIREVVEMRLLAPLATELERQQQLREAVAGLVDAPPR